MFSGLGLEASALNSSLHGLLGFVSIRVTRVHYRIGERRQVPKSLKVHTHIYIYVPS